MEHLIVDLEYSNNNFYELLKMIEISKKVTTAEIKRFNKKVLFYAPAKTGKSFILNKFCKEMGIDIFEVSIFNESKLRKIFTEPDNILKGKFCIIFLRHVNIGFNDSKNVKQLIEKLNMWIENQSVSKNIMFIIGTNEFNSNLYEICSGYFEYKFGGLSLIEKIEFAKSYLNHSILKSINLRKDEMIYIIKNYTLEAGIAQLKNCIDQILEYCLINGITIISENVIDQVLGYKKYTFNNISIDKKMGNGLAWTPYGGKILKLDILLKDGNGEINIMGNIKKTMSDSIIMAYEILRNYSKEFMIPAPDIERKNICVSIPELGESKDGASMGLAIFFKLYCIFANKQVNKPIALSGELMMNGEVIRVGGLKEKLNAAYVYDIKDIILPEKSNPELMRLPNSLVKGFEISLVNNVFELIHVLNEKQYFS